ncbi:MAG: hypothetical protein R3C56_35215 [Pirellulaceae bacterium]
MLDQCRLALLIRLGSGKLLSARAGAFSGSTAPEETTAAATNATATYLWAVFLGRAQVTAGVRLCAAECDWLFISLSGGCAVGCYWLDQDLGIGATMCQLERLGLLLDASFMQDAKGISDEQTCRNRQRASCICSDLFFRLGFDAWIHAKYRRLERFHRALGFRIMEWL